MKSRTMIFWKWLMVLHNPVEQPFVKSCERVYTEEVHEVKLLTYSLKWQQWSVAQKSVKSIGQQCT